MNITFKPAKKTPFQIIPYLYILELIILHHKIIRRIMKKINDIKFKTMIKEIMIALWHNKHKSFRLKDLDELFGYMRVSEEQSGLMVDIFVDDCGSYKQNHHPLWIYVPNINLKEFFPISISTKPKILDHNMAIKLSRKDIASIKKFIILNRRLLFQLANWEIEHIEFINMLTKVNEGRSKNEI